MWRCDEIVTFVTSSRKIVTFLKKPFQNLAASYRTWNVTKCDENVTSHHFVTVPYSNLGSGSGKIPAWNDADKNFDLDQNKKRKIRLKINSFEQNKTRKIVLVDPLCWTSWDKWNWYKFHRGYRSCPGTRKGLQRGYMTCPMGQGEVSFDLSQSQLGQAVLVPLGQPSKVSPWPSSRWFLIKNQRGPNRISEILHQKSVWNWSKILTKNRCFFY